MGNRLPMRFQIQQRHSRALQALLFVLRILQGSDKDARPRLHNRFRQLDYERLG